MKTTNSYARIFLLLIAFVVASVGITQAQEATTAPDQMAKTPPPCNCKGWKGDSVKIVSPNMSKMVKCAESVTIKKGPHALTSATYFCTPITCTPIYKWTIVGPPSGTHTGKTYPFNFSSVGTYTVTITPWCGNHKCPPCIIKVVVL